MWRSTNPRSNSLHPAAKIKANHCFMLSAFHQASENVGLVSCSTPSGEQRRGHAHFSSNNTPIRR